MKTLLVYNVLSWRKCHPPISVLSPAACSDEHMLLKGMKGILAAVMSSCVLLSGCGLFDANISILPVPKVLRYDPAKPQGKEYPDVRAIAKAHGRLLFIHKPDRIFISPPIYDRRTDYFYVCARVNDSSAQPQMVARIVRGEFVDRWPAKSQDGCDSQEFEEIGVD